MVEGVLKHVDMQALRLRSWEWLLVAYRQLALRATPDSKAQHKPV